MVAIAGRRPEQLAGVAESPRLEQHPLDATHSDEVEVLVRSLKERHGLVNAAGSLLLKPAHLTTDDEWHATLQATLTTAFAVVRAAGKVLLSSAAARIGLANHEAISAAKAGVIGLAMAAAATYGSTGLRFNVVAPGLVRTPLTSRIVENEASLKASVAMHAVGRVGEPEDVASLIAWLLDPANSWLLDPANSWVTGQVFGVDGGLGTVRTRG